MSYDEWQKPIFASYDLRHAPLSFVRGLTNAQNDFSDETGGRGGHNRKCGFLPGNDAIRTGAKRNKSNPQQRAEEPEPKTVRPQFIRLALLTRLFFAGKKSRAE